ASDCCTARCPTPKPRSGCPPWAGRPGLYQKRQRKWRATCEPKDLTAENAETTEKEVKGRAKQKMGFVDRSGLLTLKREQAGRAWGKVAVWASGHVGILGRCWA